ncbi:patatin-like phospholipase family protein [Umezawaea beigongshangensis]|uniref:patatin-like phospholipase family protein n=1 Tax=Umezawaea beigongshangensis TaxID=2780383 RepID=UPI0018F10990|nr:patatin-like phospholipase family protein [Umezawaea beigongshangensis]
MSRALVLGGGGLAGIAWEIGVLRGLLDHGVDVTDAELVVGTSAGSVVGALLTTGADLEELYQAQLEAGSGAERPVDFDAERFGTAVLEAMAGATTPQEVRARIGAIALAADTVPEAERRDVIASRLPVHEWPERRLLVVAVNAVTGEWTAFDRDSGAGLVDAVAASCAVPGVWPPITIGDDRWIDGGVRSITNADLAGGCDAVVILAPMVPPEGNPFGGPVQEAERLAATTQVRLFAADEQSAAAFGSNPLDPATRPGAARAGRAQAALVADEVRLLWGG